MKPVNAKCKYILKFLIFFIIGLVLFRCISMIFVEKSSFAKYKNYKAQNNVDILILGSSHSAVGINVVQLQDAISQTGCQIDAFNYSIYGMRIEQMYFFMQEILKEQNPSLIIIDTFSFVPIAEEHREILARRAFDAFPFSFNKQEAIQYLITEDRWSYYVPFIKYHSRWKELTADDFRMLYDQTTWAGAGIGGNGSEVSMDKIDDYFDTDTSLVTEMQPINTTEKECFEKILSLAEEKDIKILLTTVPFKEQMGMDSLQLIQINNYLRKEYVEDSDMQLLDMNLSWDEMDFGYGDLMNEGHCNASGAVKTTDLLAEYIITNYDIAELKGRQK